MNILMITPDYKPDTYGGIGTHVAGLTDSICKLGHNVTILVVHAEYFVSSDYVVEESANLRVIRFSREHNQVKHMIGDVSLNFCSFRTNYNALQAISVLHELLDKCSFDIIHVHDHFCSLIFDAVKQIYPLAAVVTTVHGCKARKMFYEDSMRRYVCMSTNAIIVVSKATEIQLRAKYGEDLPPTYICPCAIDDSKIVNDISQGDYITYVGRLHEKKGVDILLRAYAHILNSNGDIRLPPLIIAGDGPERDQLEALSQELQIDKYVTFLGWIDESEVHALLRGAMMHIVPSLFETFGMSVLEALATGCCVIASNVGGIPEYIRHGFNGLLFEVGNIEQLADCISKVSSNQFLRSMLAKNGLITSRKFTNKEIAANTISIYNDVWANHQSLPRNKTL